MTQGLLATAIERHEWELAALCLLLGITRAAASLPPDTVDALLEVLAEENSRGDPGRRRKRPGGRRGRR